MMMLFPFHSFFVLNLLLSTLFIFSSESWFSVWAGLEYNLISFVPLLMSQPTNKSTESAIKYFIIQATASILLLLLLFFFLMSQFTMSSYLLLFPLLVKLGAAPFHQWVPNVVSAISWDNVFIMLSWQKLPPIFLISTLSDSKTSLVLMLFAATSSMTGGLGGLNQTQIRSLIAYSSIGHMGWILASCLISSKITLIYTLSYIINLLPLILLLKYLSLNSLNNSISLLKVNKMVAILMFLLFFSIGGMPPLLGFLPKLLLMKNLVLMNLFLPLVFLTAGSLMNLYYYFSFAMLFCLTSNLHFKVNLSQQNMGLYFFLLISFFFFPLFLPFI